MTARVLPAADGRVLGRRVDLLSSPWWIWHDASVGARTSAPPRPFYRSTGPRPRRSALVTEPHGRTPRRRDRTSGRRERRAHAAPGPRRAAPKPRTPPAARSVRTGRQSSRRLQVLTDGQHVDAGGGAVGEQLLHLVGLLAQPHHDAGLDERACGRGKRAGGRGKRTARLAQRPGRRTRIPAPPSCARAHRAARSRSCRERRVVGLWTHTRVKARHRLQVVADHVGPCGEHQVQRLTRRRACRAPAAPPSPAARRRAGRRPRPRRRRRRRRPGRRG